MSSPVSDWQSFEREAILVWSVIGALCSRDGVGQGGHDLGVLDNVVLPLDFTSESAGPDCVIVVEIHNSESQRRHDLVEDSVEDSKIVAPVAC